MNMKLKRFFGVILSLALMLGLVPGMSLTVKAEGTAIKVGDIYKFGDTVVFNGSTQVGYSDSFDGTYTLGYGGTMGDPVVHRIVFTVSATEDKYLYLPDPNNDSTEPYGIKVKSGSGTRTDPFVFEGFRLVQYDLYVGGIQVTNANASNITGSATPAASYDANNNTLTLNGINYTGDKAGIRYTGSEALTIVLNGTNTYKGTADYNGIEVNNSTVKITGSGSLSVNCSGQNAQSIYANGITIESGTVTTQGKNGICSIGDVIITGGNMTISGTNNGIYATNNIKIENGTVTVTGDSDGLWASNGNVMISGGTVTAKGKSSNGEGIGIYGKNEVIINGGMVNASGTEVGIKSDM